MPSGKCAIEVPDVKLQAMPGGGHRNGWHDPINGQDNARLMQTHTSKP